MEKEKEIKTKMYAWRKHKLPFLSKKSGTKSQNSLQAGLAVALFSHCSVCSWLRSFLLVQHFFWVGKIMLMSCIKQNLSPSQNGFEIKCLQAQKPCYWTKLLFQDATFMICLVPSPRPRKKRERSTLLPPVLCSVAWEGDCFVIIQV